MGHIEQEKIGGRGGGGCFQTIAISNNAIAKIP